MGTTRAGRREWPLYALVATIVALIITLVAVLLARGGGPGGQQASAAQQRDDTPQRSTASSSSQKNRSPLESLARRNPGDPMAIGRVDAPVVMVAFEDLRCPFCAKFSTETAPELIERYVEMGVLRIEWRDFPIFGPKSVRAARAGRAAARQGKFWEFQHVVYSHAPETGHPALPMSKLIEYARMAGIDDIQQFRADMKDPAVMAAIRKDIAQGTSIGVTSTPTFVINGRPVVGAQPLEVFVQVIEHAKKVATS